MRFGICLSNIGSFSDPQIPLELALAAETSGWDGVFSWDHLAFAWGAPAADPWTILSAIANLQANPQGSSRPVEGRKNAA